MRIQIANITFFYFACVIMVFIILFVTLSGEKCAGEQCGKYIIPEFSTKTTHVLDLKIILLWNKYFHNYDYTFGTDGKQFAGPNRCPVDNCMVTYDRTLRPVEDYDAIVMHGLSFKKHDAVPKTRSRKQYYVFVSMESPARNKINSFYNDFFNWTMTYRFDSDFVWPYYKMKANDGSVISPSLNPKWGPHYGAVNSSIVPSLAKKTKKVAWFVSHCNADNTREQYVKQLQKYIQVDVYGGCGLLKCPRKRDAECFAMLRDDYFFYLALENSHCKDYMTEKAYNALLHDAIPVLFGSANYTNFIPPHSYLDANLLDPQQLAYVMNGLTENPDEYSKYFWWKGMYTFHNLGDEYRLAEPELHPLCEMCKALNDPGLKPKTYKNLVQWWQEGIEPTKPVCVRPNTKFL